MNLNELQETKKTKVVKRALKEHYELDIDFDRLTLQRARAMLNKVHGLIKESQSVKTNYINHNNSTYLKLVMLEQALQDRLADLRHPIKNIVIENEEVQKSQVILAAQDMVDSLQKMLESVSKMNVEELAAVSEGVKNEFGAAEGDQFQLAVSQALTGLQDTIKGAKDTVSGALSRLTGDTAMASELEVPGSLPADEPAMGQEPMVPEMPAEPMEPGEPEEEETPDASAAGRERR